MSKCHISNNIRVFRFHNSEMTQQQLADKTGVTRQTIVAIEQGKYSPSLELAFRISRIFNSSLEDLFSYTDEENQKKTIFKNINRLKTMKTTEFSNEISEHLMREGSRDQFSGASEVSEFFEELKCTVYHALSHYSNVHRGSGHNSLVSTKLYEQARAMVLECMKLTKDKYVVIFCTPRRAEYFRNQLLAENYHIISSKEIGLALGVTAMAVNKKCLKNLVHFQSGGGTAKLISKSYTIWEDTPERFEAGTPAIINVIAFAKALRQLNGSTNKRYSIPESKGFTSEEILYRDDLEAFSGRELLNELRKTLIGRDLFVPTTEGSVPFTNLDNSASTRTFEPIWKTVYTTWQQSNHIHKEIIQEVRFICSEVLGAPLNDYDVLFTSNTTEAINIAAESFRRKKEENIEPVVLNTFLEHSSNDLPWRKASDNPIIRLMVDREGFIDLKELESTLNDYNNKRIYGKKRIKLVAVTGASNVLGVCNDISEIGRIVHLYGARLLVDAAQLAAHRKVEIENWGIDYLAFSGHKVYAPFGSGVLIVKKGLLKFNSAEMELINSSGEENVGGIAGLGKALLLIQRIGYESIQEEESFLTKRALTGLGQMEGLEIYGIKDPESPVFSHKIGVIVFSMKGMIPNQVAAILAESYGIGVRYGCHCSHIIIKHLLKVTPSLERFQRLLLNIFPKLRLPGLVRVSFGLENRSEDVDKLINALKRISDKQISKRGDVKKLINDFTRDTINKVYSNN